MTLKKLFVIAFESVRNSYFCILRQLVRLDTASVMTIHTDNFEREFFQLIATVFCVNKCTIPFVISENVPISQAPPLILIAMCSGVKIRFSYKTVICCLFKFSYSKLSEFNNLGYHYWKGLSLYRASTKCYTRFEQFTFSRL